MKGKQNKEIANPELNFAILIKRPERKLGQNMG